MKINKYLITLIILLIINLDVFYLVDTNVKFFSSFDFDDIAFGISIVLFLYLIFINRNLEKPKYNYKLWFIFMLVMIFLSSFQSYILYNQNIFDGFLPQKDIIIFSLLYFPLSKAIFNKKITIDNIKKILNVFAVIQLILFISQFLLSDKITFLYINTASRYGEIRYYFNPILLDYFLLVNLNNLLDKKHILRSIIFISLVLFDVMIVQKFRLTSVGLIIIIAIGMLFNGRKINEKFKYILLLGIFAVFILNTTLVQDVIKEVFNTNTTSSTLSIRKVGRQLYFNTLSKHPLLCGGYPKKNEALLAAGMFNKIYLVDNGIFGFMYIYGSLGILWFVTLWYKMITCGYKIMKKNKNIVYFLFATFFVITSIDEAHWYWQSGFCILVIFILMLEYETKKLKI